MFPVAAAIDSGRLARPDGASLWWERSGRADGVPLIYLHGGPGSGLGGAHYRSLFDPERFLIVGLDQRGSGRSLPLADASDAVLARNTTATLIEDLEALRDRLGIDRWIVAGVSWGSTLGLAYAEAVPDRVRALALAAVTTTSAREVEWLTEGIGRLIPVDWKVFAEAVDREPEERVVDAYRRALRDERAEVRQAAADAWCRWEDRHVAIGRPVQPSARFEDARFRLLFATLVVHYFASSGFPVHGGIWAHLDRIAHLPIELVHGEADLSSPAETAYRLHRLLPSSRLHLLPATGHGGERLFETFGRVATELLERS